MLPLLEAVMRHRVVPSFLRRPSRLPYLLFEGDTDGPINSTKSDRRGTRHRAALREKTEMMCGPMVFQSSVPPSGGLQQQSVVQTADISPFKRSLAVE
jgi:hypothetical protein